MTGSESATLRRVIGLCIAVAALLGVAAAGGSIVRSSSTEATARQAFPYALIGGAAGVLLAGIVLVSIRLARRGAFRLRAGELLAILFIAAALGALLGAALTPRTPSPDEVSPLDQDEIDRREEQAGEMGSDTRVGPVDQNGDGRADVDADGNTILAYDRDGDGVLDGYLTPCPVGTPVPPARPGYTAFDAECDGTVDQWLRYDPSVFLDGDEPFLDQPPTTISPEQRQDRADDQGARGQAGGVVAKVLLLLLAVAVCAAIIVWVVRMPDRDRKAGTDTDDPADDGSDDAGDAPPDLTRSLTASLDTMLEDPDPRAAICAAYGRLLDGFAEAGLPRRAEEAPEEHVARVMAAARIDPGPVRELLRLFSYARFSSHPVDESHRVAAVRAMRAALAGMGAGREPVGAGVGPAGGNGTIPPPPPSGARA